MDDELKAIQDDLDSVLSRLAHFIEQSGASSSPPEDAARVAYHYGITQPGDLQQSVSALDSVKPDPVETFGPDSRLSDAPSADKQPELAALMGALRGVVGYQITHMPLNRDQMWALYESIAVWGECGSQFIGEEAGLELTPKRQVDRRLMDRRQAVAMVFAMHWLNPKECPIDEGLFGMVGEMTNMSAKTVSRAYYSGSGKYGRQLAQELIDTFVADPEANRSLRLNMAQSPEIQDYFAHLAANPEVGDLFSPIVASLKRDAIFHQMVSQHRTWEVFPDAPWLSLPQSAIDAMFAPISDEDTTFQLMAASLDAKATFATPPLVTDRRNLTITRPA